MLSLSGVLGLIPSPKIKGKKVEGEAEKGGWGRGGENDYSLS